MIMPQVRTVLPRLGLLCLALLSFSSAWLGANSSDTTRIGFSFNEGTVNGTGGVVTDYYSTRDGTFLGFWYDDLYFESGRSGEEGDFSITSGGNRVSVDVTSAFGTDWGSFTIETHFTPGAPGSFRRLIELQGLGIALQKNSINQLRPSLMANDSSNQTSALSEDQWYHVALVYDASGADTIVRFYLDGELIASGPPALEWPASGPSNLFIGAAPTGGSSWNGKIDDFRITQSPLSPAEFLLTGFGSDLAEPPPPPPERDWTRIGFSFNEGTVANTGGVITDYYSSQNGNFVGVWSDDLYFRPGFTGEDGDFSVTSGGNRVSVDVTSAFGTDWGSFTIETHFTPGAPGSFRRLVDIQGLGVALQKNSINQLRPSLMANDGSNQTPALAEDQWYHAALVYDASGEETVVRFYLDGQLIASAPPAHEWPANGPSALFIGSATNGGSSWNGKIDDFRITQGPLTPAEFLLDGFGPNLTEPPPPLPEPDWARIGFSFNEGTTTGTGGVVRDFYSILNGSFVGIWEGDTYFRSGFSGEEEDFSITSGGNRVTLNATSAFGSQWGSFTIETHFTPGAPGSFRRLIELQGLGVALQKNSINQLRPSLMADSASKQTPQLSADQWYHTALVYDVGENETTVRFYLDGELIASGPPAYDWPSEGPSNLFLGASPTGGSFWNGLIDDFRISQSALQPHQFLTAGFGSELAAPTEPPPPAEPLPDAAEIQLFWTELALGEIHTARADGSERAVLVTGLDRPIGIVLDQTGGLLYWSEDGEAGGGNNGRIGRSNLNGTDVTILYAASLGDAGLGNPQGLAIDFETGNLYWADYTTGIYRAPIDGNGPVEALYLAPWERFTAVAIDPINQHIYFGPPQSGDLWRTDLNGDNFQFGPSGLTKAWGFNGLTIDPVAGKLYFSDLDAVWSTNLDGSNPEPIASGLSRALGVALDAKRQSVFYTERDSQRIGVGYVDGTGFRTLLTGLDSPFGIAVMRTFDGESPFTQWQKANFTAEELADKAISGPTATPAQDGVPNLLKFALGLDPNQSARNLLPSPQLVNGNFQVSFTQSLATLDANVVIEVSSDLSSWTPATGAQLDVQGMDDYQLVTFSVAASGKLFIRLRASLVD
jgi:hypothetical protein